MTEIFDITNRALIHITKDMSKLQNYELILMAINTILISLLIIMVCNLIQNIKQQ